MLCSLHTSLRIFKCTCSSASAIGARSHGYNYTKNTTGSTIRSRRCIDRHGRILHICCQGLKILRVLQEQRISRSEENKLAHGRLCPTLLRSFEAKSSHCSSVFLVCCRRSPHTLSRGFTSSNDRTQHKLQHNVQSTGQLLELNPSCYNTVYTGNNFLGVRDGSGRNHLKNIRQLWWVAQTRLKLADPVASICRSLNPLIKRCFSIDTYEMADNKYVVGYAKLGTSSCKKCRQKIDKGGLRIGKVTTNPFSDDGGDMKQWFHPVCIFETFVKARAATKKIEEPEDAEGFGDLNQEDKDVIKQLIEDYQTKAGSKPSPKPKKTGQRTITSTPPVKTTPTGESSGASSNGSTDDDGRGPSTSHTSAKKVTTPPATDDPFSEKDNSFREFRRLCADIAEENSYLEKTKLVNTYITKGHSADGFRGDLYLLIKLLLPGVVKTVYNLNNKQLVKLFSQIFGINLQRMVADLDQGDVAETIRWAFDESKVLVPQKKSVLSLQEVDAYLDELSQMSKEEEQQKVLTKVAKRCTSNDLKMFVRLIKHDLRINSGAKHILDGLDPNAYAAFQASRNLQDVVERVTQNRAKSSEDARPGMSKKLSVRAALMTPVLPMLADACRSVEQAMKKCPKGFYAEIKYDGERVQVHKRGNDFKFFSRSLKPVLEHKIKLFRDFIPKAFATSNDLILDAEVLLVDNTTGNPLPFGTLGVHKKAAFQEATVCLFVFDCLLLNDENLMNRPIKDRRQILEKNMTVVKNHVNLSEIKLIKKPADLQELMARVFREGLEGLVLKDVNGIYEPGKRHWLKVKKDYLHEGSMADAADLVVLGAYYGTGNKGGMMSIFLMGVYDPDSDTWVTVSKCGSGLDDKKLESLNKELDVVKISKDFSKVPSWLHINKPLTPDFVVADPKKAPVWEIIGAEFSQAEIHTADGISIRFPRIQKFRDDKTWKEATDLPRLKLLFKQSKEKSDMDLMRALGKDGSGSDDEEGSGDTDVESDEANGGGTSSAAGEMWSQKANRKRAASGDNELDESPTKKVKPLCRYGADCYQKNPQHRQDFDHQPKTPIQKNPQHRQDFDHQPKTPIQKNPQHRQDFDHQPKTPIQKNPQHLQDFDHQPKTPIQKKISMSLAAPARLGDANRSQSKKLPSVFQGCKIVLPSSVEKYKELKRYILAFDGDLLHEFDARSATHIIADLSNPAAKSGNPAAQVNSDWLWTCIRKKHLVPTDPYRVSSSGS